MSDKYRAFKDAADGDSEGKKRDEQMLDDEDEPDQREADGLDDVLPPPPARRETGTPTAARPACPGSAPRAPGARPAVGPCRSLPPLPTRHSRFL